MKPPFKWAGGKRRLAQNIIDILGPIKGRYIEPFCGSAAVFFALRDNYVGPALLNDISRPVVMTLQALQSSAETVMAEMQVLLAKQLTIGHVKCYEYLKARVGFPECLSAPTYAAYFLATNATSFNGLWRVNASGGYNVPIGRRYLKSGKAFHDIPTRDLTLYQQALRTAVITHGDYRDIVTHPGPIIQRTRGDVAVGKGDVIYCDPPYLGKFAGYSSGGFGAREHRELFDWCVMLRGRGARVIVSGSDTPETREIYGEPTGVVGIANTIGASKRGQTTELIYVI